MNPSNHINFLLDRAAERCTRQTQTLISSPFLFINFNQQYPSSITIDYIPEFTSAEQIDDSYWQNIIQQYSLALVKISLSHFRGKYVNVTGQPFTLNYDRLAAEGKEERDKIWNELVESNLLNYRFS